MTRHPTQPATELAKLAFRFVLAMAGTLLLVGLAYGG